jgi:hypothetical protein
LEFMPKRFRVPAKLDVLVEWSTLSHGYSLSSAGSLASTLYPCLAYQ